ncbi:SRPBCC domain-containing protein [uncultured Roseibium sp.]|uniref:SRPBCC domain-containing protein n=1 Tax=uncultured Roseibium sp. TaxID=1936171 RepID=UPI00261BB678|nr:SRPBCC domain-containing protein [uncultured Roseibium sp.]
MALSFKIAGRINKPVSEVFEAVVNPDRLSGYFTTGGADGRLEPGVTVTWAFAEFPGRFPVKIDRVEKDSLIVLRWAAQESGEVSSTGETPEPAGYDTTVTMAFEPLDGGRTLVTISEEGWRDTKGGLEASYGNCEGWTQMLCSLKGFVEHGINLREGFYK